MGITQTIFYCAKSSIIEDHLITLKNVPSEIEVLIEIFFLLDIFLNCITEVVNPRNQQIISNVSKITKLYLKNRFLLDFLAVVPFYYILEGAIENKDSLRLVFLLKLLRIKRILQHVDKKIQTKVIKKYY